MVHTRFTAASSFIRYVVLVGRRAIRLRYKRVGSVYLIEGDRYKIFRETVSNIHDGNAPVILVIGFRLKLIRSNVFFHWLFQRICIVTTPFWSGLSGFKVKLWMVHPATKNYLGVYEWRGMQNANMYLGFLMPILRFFSVKDSVWVKQFSGLDLEGYLSRRLH